VIVGGNLSVGSHKDDTAIDRLYALGVDLVLQDPDELPAVLADIAAGRRRAGASELCVS
jgi:methylaspartate mutase sigma subunit